MPATSTCSSTTKERRMPVALYVPNILCYIRIVTAFLGLYYSRNHRPLLAAWIWLFSAGLDLFDGLLARALHQTSTLGIYLDITADNILRTCIWMAAMLEQSDNVVVTMIACVIVCTEWLTMASTQVHAANGGHWKTARLHDPWLVQKVFEGGFKSPFGVWTIFGLFTTQMFLWGSAHDEVLDVFSAIPCYHVFKYVAYSGRAFGFGIEMYMTGSYLSHVIGEDTKRRDAEAKER
jgi:phosphatidylglycerophosphate synthase